MKKQILLFIAALIAVIQPAPAEDKVFPESDAIWNVQVTHWTGAATDIRYIYGLSGDTIINNKKYNKLYLLNDTTLHIDHNDTYVGGIREENKQVWFQIHDYDDGWGHQKRFEEYVLYDFSREEGDEFTRNNVLLFLGNYGELEVHTFDEEIVTKIIKMEETTQGKHFYVNYHPSYETFDAVWMEGIGSTNGIVWDQFIFAMSDTRSLKLACFKQGDEVIYLDNEFGGCFCERPSGDAIDFPESHSVLVFADKESASIKVVANKLQLSFELLNLQGQMLLQEKINSHPQSISYDGLPKGLYIYRITDNGKIIQTGKLIPE